MPLCVCSFLPLKPAKAKALCLSWVTLRAPEDREVMTGVTRTDGSVAAGGNTLITRKPCVYIVAPACV